MTTSEILKHRNTLICCLSALAWGMLLRCDTTYNEVDLYEAGQKFYPLEPGLYREYQIEYIKYEILGNHDTLNYFLKEQVADTFINQTGGVSYKINRYKKIHQNQSWELDSVWSTFKTTINVVAVENNIPYVKLVFPVTYQMEWDGNAFNILNEEIYRYENINHNVSIGDNVYNSTIKVIQNDNTDAIVSTNIRNEIYAENIGLIYKESIILHYCTDIECIGDKIIEQGIIYKQVLTGHGKD